MEIGFGGLAKAPGVYLDQVLQGFTTGFNVGMALPEQLVRDELRFLAAWCLRPRRLQLHPEFRRLAWHRCAYMRARSS